MRPLFMELLDVLELSNLSGVSAYQVAAAPGRWRRCPV
jgi:hypothetical protein